MLPLCLPACLPSCCLLVAQDYKSGKMMSGEIKAKLIDVLNEIIANHNAPRGAQNWESRCILQQYGGASAPRLARLGLVCCPVTVSPPLPARLRSGSAERHARAADPGHRRLAPW